MAAAASALLCRVFQTTADRPGFGQCLNHMIADYIGSRADVGTFRYVDPIYYWVSRLNHGLELAQYALQLVDCPGTRRPSVQQ